jgi:hypothetical protein
LKESEIKEIVKKLKPKTEEKVILDMCNTLQKIAQNSFQLISLNFLPFIFFIIDFSCIR